MLLWDIEMARAKGYNLYVVKFIMGGFMKKISKFSSFVLVFMLSLSTLGTLNFSAAEINGSERLVDPVCSYSKKKVEDNKKVYFYHPQLGQKWQYANNYYLSASKGGINLSFGYGPVSVAYSKSGSGGYTVPANYNKQSKLKMRETGDVYKITPSSCNPYYDFKEEVEYAYAVYR